jgi:Transcriptional regulatory protein, C terminal
MHQPSAEYGEPAGPASLAGNSRPDIRLTPTEWHLLEVLVRQLGKLLSRQHLLTEVWGSGSSQAATGNLRLYINQLQHKLEPGPAALAADRAGNGIPLPAGPVAAPQPAWLRASCAHPAAAACPGRESGAELAGTVAVRQADEAQPQRPPPPPHLPGPPPPGGPACSSSAPAPS